jgi:hypothetical protein
MDHILYWNEVALEANKRDFSNVPGTNKPSPQQGGPTLSSRALAIIHLAMYDAHAGAVKKPDLKPYLTGLNTSGISKEDAAQATAYAAYTTLSALFSRQTAFFDEKLQNSGVMTAVDTPGKNFGIAVAQMILDDRKFDPSPSTGSYRPSQKPRHHRQDPANPNADFHGPTYGAASKCFAVTQRHGLDQPYASDHPEYLRSFRQVRGKGIAPTLMGTLPEGSNKRTADETMAGLFWAYDGVREIGTPPRLYNQILRDIAKHHKNDIDKNARWFALVNVAMGDAGILAWEQKYIHDLWRPVVGIREHDVSTGPGAVAQAKINKDADPEWLPLGAPGSNSYIDGTGLSDRDGTPPFPAYPSGHATFGAAAFHMVRLLCGVAIGDRQEDHVFTCGIGSDELNGKTRDSRGVVRTKHLRKFPGGLWKMIEENGFSRVYLGVHWSFDAFALDAAGNPDLSQNIGGVPLGLKIAEDIFTASQGGGPSKSTVGPRCQ